MRTLMFLLPALLAACGARPLPEDPQQPEPISIEGDLDGEQPKLVDGFFFHADAGWRNDEGIVVVLSSFPDSCGALSELFAEIDVLLSVEDPETRAEEMADAWEDLLPDEFWQIEITMRIGDDGDSLEGEEIDGVGWGDGLGEAGEAEVVLIEQKKPFDFDYFFDDVEWDEMDDYYTEYLSDGGDLQIEEHDPSDSMSGTFSFEAGEDSDDPDEFELEVHFEVERCSDIEPYYLINT
jgi:hypothetical protein